MRFVSLFCIFLFHFLSWGNDFVDHSAKTGSRDVMIPRALVARIEKDYQEFLEKEGVLTPGPIQRMLLNVRAELWQERPGALHENARILTPLGGGVVDLADIVTPLRGSFWMKIHPYSEKSGGKLDNARFFFVSRAKVRSIQGETYGAGCDRWMDITSYFNQVMAGKGFQLYSTDQRYLSVVGGTFLAVNFTKEAIAVASLTFTDSRYPEMLCE